VLRRGLAVAKGGGKWKYMGSEKAMLDAAEKFSPYR
jgi:DNA-3-methyladenine glycosylase II